MKLSIRNKTIIMILTFAVALAVTAILVGRTIVRKMTNNDYTKDANNLAATVAVVVDVDKVKSLRDAMVPIYDGIDEHITSDDWGSPEFEEYLANYVGIEEREDFIYLREQLTKIQDQNDVNCIYLLYVDGQRKECLYLCDADPEEPCPPGVIDPLLKQNFELIDDPGRGMPAYITNTDEYGWLVTAAAPIYDQSGDFIAYAAVDISMDEVKAQQMKYMFTTTAILIAIIILISVIGIYIVNKYAVRPINILSEAATGYFQDSDATTPRNRFANLNIHTHDEIETLANSMKQMEQDINDYFAELMVTTEVLSETEKQAYEMQKEASRLSRIAMVDDMTKVRNKRAFDEAVKDIDDDINYNNAVFALVLADMNNLKETNDTYGHDKGDIAIKSLCKLVCSVYKHSPVFRIGGDEFVAILRGQDYENAEALAEEFDNRCSSLCNDISLKPWERISAAIGWTTYRPSEDISFSDVFKRADEAMYKKKKEMKGIE